MRYLIAFVLSVGLSLVPKQISANTIVVNNVSSSLNYQNKEKKTKFIYQTFEQELDTTALSKINMQNHVDRYLTLEEKLDFVNTYVQFTSYNNLIEHKIFAYFLKSEIYTWGGKHEDAVENYQEVIKLSKKLQNKNGEFLAYSGLFHLYQQTQAKDSVQFYKNMSEQLSPDIKNPHYKAIQAGILSVYYMEKEEFIKALDILLAINEVDVLKESNTRCAALTNLGWMYEHLNYQEHAKIYYLKGMEVAKKIKSLDYINFFKLKLGHIELFNLNNADAALRKYTELMPIYEHSGSYKEGVLYGTMGFAYLKLGQKKESFLYLTKSRDFLEKHKFNNFLCLPYTYLAHYYLADNQFDKAIESGEMALKIIENQKLFSGRKLILLDKLAEAYKATGNTARALSLLEELNTIKTNLEIKKNNIAFAESVYQLNENKEQLEIAELNNQLLQKNRFVYLSLLGILTIGLFFTLYLYNNRQKTNRKLKQLDVLKTNFFTNISHEFRTPLTLISSPIQETLAEPDLSLEKRSHFEMASKNTERLLTLVDQLLELSKIDSGNLKLQLEENKITGYIAALAESFSYLAKQKGIDLKVHIKDIEQEVWFDRDTLEKITVNLLGNAIKYTPKKGKIVVIATIDKNQLLLQIKNTGKGLTKQQQTTLFKRFYQTDEQNEGVGVGLALVKELATLHKGKITVHSTPDSWTTFKVSLCVNKKYFKNALIKTCTVAETSIAKKESHHELTENQNQANIENPILLIVEDNADLQILLSNIFKGNYQIITANNGEEGINMALQHIPDLIISDVMMPLKDGIELTKTLKADERTSHIPIILLTAKAGAENELMGIGEGADDYITKPFNQKILKAKVNSLIALRKKLQSRYRQEVILKPKDIAITSIDQLFLEKVQKVFDENLIESSFNAEAFSLAVNMSRMQLHRKLKALLGVSTSEFLRSERLKLSIELLKKPNANVSQVGYSIGFNDPNYFTKCFKEAYKCTPSAYILKQKTTS